MEDRYEELRESLRAAVAEMKSRGEAVLRMQGEQLATNRVIDVLLAYATPAARVAAEAALDIASEAMPDGIAPQSLGGFVGTREKLRARLRSG